MVPVHRVGLDLLGVLARLPAKTSGADEGGSVGITRIAPIERTT